MSTTMTNPENIVRSCLTADPDVTAIGVTREDYLDLIELVLDQYPPEQLTSRIRYDGDYLDLQAYSRITLMLTTLVTHGRRTERLDECESMVSQCCRELLTIRESVVADFSLKEIMLAVELLGSTSDPVVVQQWLDNLREFDPSVGFKWILRRPGDEVDIHNINIYNMSGEYLRHRAGLVDATEYLRRHWAVQLPKFDESGMYVDPGSPILYDLTTRCQMQLPYLFDYDGPFASEIDDVMRRGGFATLLAQSATGELAYGGRSSQYLHNEVLIATNCEYEAVRHQRLGDLRLAGAFKRAAGLAVRSIRHWLAMRPVRHIKNSYPIDSNHGCEWYGRYDIYMATAGAFLVQAFLSADDDIAERACPSEIGGYTWVLSDHFHKVVITGFGSTAQIDFAADPAYDSTGLGRWHRAGVPTALGLSTPLTSGDGYETSGLPRTDATIGPAWIDGEGTVRTLAGMSGAVQVEVHPVPASPTAVDVVYRGDALGGPSAVRTRTSIAEDGLTLEIALDDHSGPLLLQVPVLESTGTEATEVSIQANGFTVKLDDAEYQVWCPDPGVEAELGHTAYGSRNGRYRIGMLRSRGPRMRVHLQLSGTAEESKGRS